MDFNKLSLTEKFGQTIMLGLDTYELNDEIIRIIEDYKIGGVVLYQKNYTSIDTMISFINRLKKINSINKIPLFIAIDQENGRVNRFPKDITRISSPLKQAKKGSMEIINLINEITCYLLKNTGVNMNFAPVLDIVRSDKNKVIGNRSYGSNIIDVTKYALPFMKTMQKNNIISVVKHFPGLGSTNKDSHIIIPTINDIKNIEDDIKVFSNAIKYGADAIMVDHVKIKGYGLKPATINKSIIEKLLIKENKFNGLIITDDLRMNFLKTFFGLKRCVKDSLNASVNMVMVKYKKGDYKLYKKLFKMVRECEIDPELVNNSANKVLLYKQKYKVNDKEIINKINIDLVNKKINKINDIINSELN